MDDPDRDVVSATERASNVLRGVADEWMRRKGVISVEVARSADERTSGRVAIRVTVERKLPPDRVPEGELLPSRLEGITVEVIEGRRAVPQADPRR